MKIAVVEFAGKGGMIHYAFQLCRALQQEGADVTLLTDEHYELERLEHPFRLERLLHLWDPKPEHDELSRSMRRIRRAGRAARYYREWGRLLGRLRTLAPDVTQFGDIRFATDVAPIKAAKRSSRLLADVCHNVRPFSGGEGSSGKFELSAVERTLYRRLYRQFDSIFVHYDVNVREFGLTFPDSDRKVVRIVHGNEEIFRELASPSLTDEDIRNELRIAPDQRIVLFFGTLSRYKGLDLLLEAFTSVVEHHHDATLVLAGYPFSDFDPAAFLAEAQAAGIADRVRIVPRYIPSDAVATWVSLASVVVFPYRNIYQSGALHVAQTLGAPIVATDVGAMGEVLRNDVSGIIVLPDDAVALARGIGTLLSNTDFAKRIGAQAAEDAATRFSWRSVARVMLAEYQRKLSAG